MTTKIIHRTSNRTRLFRHALPVVTISAALTLVAAAPSEARARRCVVPHLAGQSLRTAKSLVKADGCRVGPVLTPRGSGPLVVSSTSPRAGTRHAHGTKVKIVLTRQSSTPAPVPTPSPYSYPPGAATGTYSFTFSQAAEGTNPAPAGYSAAISLSPDLYGGTQTYAQEQQGTGSGQFGSLFTAVRGSLGNMTLEPVGCGTSSDASPQAAIAGFCIDQPSYAKTDATGVNSSGVEWAQTTDPYGTTCVIFISSTAPQLSAADQQTYGGAYEGLQACDPTLTAAQIAYVENNLFITNGGA